jgi:hypothetical protein
MIHESSGTRQGAQPGRGVAFALALGVCLALLAGPRAWGQRRGGMEAARPAPAPRAPMKPSPMRPAEPSRHAPEAGGQNNLSARPRTPAVMQPGTNPNAGFGRRPGQEHLPEWLNEHQNLSPQQQENLLRREPGFNRLASSSGC